MRPCLVAYVNHFLDRKVRHNYKFEKLEIRAVMKYLCKKAMPVPSEFIKTSWEPLRKSLLIIITATKLATVFTCKRWRKSVEDDGWSIMPILSL